MEKQSSDDYTTGKHKQTIYRYRTRVVLGNARVPTTRDMTESTNYNRRKGVSAKGHGEVFVRLCKTTNDPTIQWV